MSERGPFSRFLRDVFNAGAAARDVITSRVPRAPLGLVLYDGFGARDRILVHGRALRDEGLGTPNPNDPRWRNLLATVRRADADPIAHAAVRVVAGRSTHDFVCDEEGFFHGWMSAPGLSSADDWVSVTAELLTPAPDEGSVRSSARVLFPAADPGLLIISDIDDTVLQTDATSVLRMARSVLFGSARTRLPFSGVSAFYRALRLGRQGATWNPLFYISSSPWNLYDLLIEFFELERIPAGPLLLRDWGITRDELFPTRHAQHKRDAIDLVLSAYPALPFLLIGDSGQEDPEIYRDIVHRHGDRILAVYIRNVSGLDRAQQIHELSREVVAAGSSLVLADDTSAAARHASEHGWIDAAWLPKIDAACREDEAGAPGTPVVRRGQKREDTPTVTIAVERV